MRHAKGICIPRTSGAARLVAALVVDARKEGTFDERRTQAVQKMNRLLQSIDSFSSTTRKQCPKHQPQMLYAYLLEK
jgi:hypothetical protein